MFSLHWALLNPAKGALMNTCGWLLSYNVSFVPRSPLPEGFCCSSLSVIVTAEHTHWHCVCEELIVWYSVTDLNYSIWYFLQRICASGGGFWFSYILTLKNIPPNCWPILPHRVSLCVRSPWKQKSTGLENKHVLHKHFTFCWLIFEWCKTNG